MSNEIEKIEPITELPESKQKGWIKVGIMKANLEADHQRAGLELQGILLNAGNSITEREEALKAYRKRHTDMVAAGTQFRSLITEKVLQPSINAEKENSPKENTRYQSLDKLLIDQKQEQQKVNQGAVAKEQEKQQYIAHIKNQCELLVADLKKRALNELFVMYSEYLKGKVQNPDIEAIKDTIKGMTFSNPVQFKFQYHTDEEKKAISATVNKPKLQPIIQSLLDEVDKKFVTYQNDLKSKAPANVDLFHQEQIAEIEKNAQINVGINQLEAQATPVSIVTEGKALKEMLTIVEEDSEAWALKVIAGFMKFPLCRPHLRVRSWSNLKVSQMAEALAKYATETGEKVEGLNYQKQVK